MDKNLENDIPTFSIKELAGILRGSEETEKKTIFFIGAGFSISGGIPCAEGIKEDVKKKIRDLGSVASSEYPDLMKKLTIEDRRKLFKGYMENSWVNPAHMYLAELYDEYVDFILTTNFDDLILQSLAIRNVFPPTYDMPLIHKEDLGTTEFEIGSVFYLHGQRYGLHHLHTQEEMLRVKDVVESVLRSIVAGRPWIVVGYSGRDPIFECMCNLGSFNSGLYWIAHEERSFNDYTAPFYKKGKLGGLRKLIYEKGADLFMHDLYKEVKRGRESGISFSPYQTKWEDKIKFLENMASLYSEDNEYLKLSFEDRAKFEKLMVSIFYKSDSGEYNTNLIQWLRDIRNLINNPEVYNRLFKSDGILDEMNNRLKSNAFKQLGKKSKKIVLDRFCEEYKFFLSDGSIRTQTKSIEKVSRLYAGTKLLAHKIEKNFSVLIELHNLFLDIEEIEEIKDVETYDSWNSVLKCLLAETKCPEEQAMYSERIKENRRSRRRIQNEQKRIESR